MELRKRKEKKIFGIKYLLNYYSVWNINKTK